MGKAKRYDYIHHVVWKLTPGGPEADAKRILRKLVREAVMTSHKGVTSMEFRKTEADRIARELVP